ncbi:MAG TPA: sulfite exporter TauE/SafE family protein [Acidimicrobiia bacterium]
MALAVGVGSLVQGSIGFGSNLVAVPVLALANPEALPATLTMVVIPLVVAMAVRERHAVDRAGVTWITLGRIPGTAIGAWIVAVVSGATLSVLLGSGVLVAVALTGFTEPVPVNRTTTATAGFASGVMGTSTAIGGPPMALLYQHHEGPVLRSTLAWAFAFGTAMSLAGLVIGGVVHLWHLALAAALLPALGLGLFLSRYTVGRLEGRWLRPAVLSFAAVTAVWAIVRGLTG